MKELVQRINDSKSWFFEMKNKGDNLSVLITKRNRCYELTIKNEKVSITAT